MVAIESALVVLVPEAEVIVRPFRDKYDHSAVNGCPAHVGVLYPFKRPDEITKTDYVNLSRCVAPFKPFHFSLAVTRRFPGVLYFAPEPDEPFGAGSADFQKWTLCAILTSGAASRQK
jgi:hypothetical protein